MRKTRVMFLCTGNSCRSQMAEGFARHLVGDKVEAFSAGVKTNPVDPRAIKAMAEVGVDISGQQSKLVTEFADVEMDYVVTLCSHAHQTCPVFPARSRVLHHGFDDPPALARDAPTEEEAMAPYRRVRDEIREFVLAMPQNLVQLSQETPKIIVPKT